MAWHHANFAIPVPPEHQESSPQPAGSERKREAVWARDSDLYSTKIKAQEVQVGQSADAWDSATRSMGGIPARDLTPRALQRGTWRYTFWLAYSSLGVIYVS